MPACNTEAMNLHLAEIALMVAPGAHAVLLVDQAGWHLSARLVIPTNITILPMPPKSPELNPVENIWQFMRDNGSQTASSNPTTISSTTAARHGTSSSTSLGGSCPLVCANGRTGSDQRELVLVPQVLRGVSQHVFGPPSIECRKRVALRDYRAQLSARTTRTSANTP